MNSRFALACLVASLLAGSAAADGRVEVKGYYRRDGTYVRPHTRALPGSRTTAPVCPPIQMPRTAPPPPARTGSRTAPPASPPAAPPAAQAASKSRPQVEFVANKVVAPDGHIKAVLATDWRVMDEYLTAYTRSRDADVKALLRDGKVVFVTEPLMVAYETTFKGLCYVRPTEGPHARKLFVVEERFLYDLEPEGAAK